MKRRSTLRIALCLLVPLLLVSACSTGPKPTPPASAAPASTEAPPAATAAPATATNVPAARANPNINPLTGKNVPDAAALQHRVILVRYGNDRIARPPSGLAGADLVFEELAEGRFVTRLTGAFLDTLPEAVGPVRSARPAVIDYMQQLDAVLVYAGASVGTTNLLNQQPYPQYAQVGRGADLFYRSEAKPAPHNLYVKLPTLRERMIAEKVDKPANLQGMVFSPTPPLGKQATKVHIPYPGEAPVDYAYDPASGAYLRSAEGVPHTDALTGKQLAPQNVLVVYAEHKDSDIVEDSLGNVAILIKLVGKGKAQIFRDGTMVEGTWQRDEASQLASYKDAAGNDIPLKPGQSWVEIVPLEYQVSVQ